MEWPRNNWGWRDSRVISLVRPTLAHEARFDGCRLGLRGGRREADQETVEYHVHLRRSLPPARRSRLQVCWSLGARALSRKKRGRVIFLPGGHDQEDSSGFGA